MPGVTTGALCRCSSSESVPRQLGSLVHCSFFKNIFPSEALCYSGWKRFLHNRLRVYCAYPQHSTCLPAGRSNSGFLLSDVEFLKGRICPWSSVCSEAEQSLIYCRTDPQWYELSRGQKGQAGSLG